MGVVVSPDGKRVYVANGHAGTVAVIDAASHRVVSTIRAGRRPWGIAMSPDGKRLFTANGASNNVSVIDTDSLRVVANILIGQGSWGVAVVTRSGDR